MFYDYSLKILKNKSEWEEYLLVWCAIAISFHHG